MKLWKNTQSPEAFANNPELTDDQATQALERARSTSIDVVYTMLDGAIPRLHKTVDDYRFRGLPAEELEKNLAEVVGLIRSVLQR